MKKREQCEMQTVGKATRQQYSPSCPAAVNRSWIKTVNRSNGITHQVRHGGAGIYGKPPCSMQQNRKVQFSSNQVCH